MAKNLNHHLRCESIAILIDGAFFFHRYELCYGTTTIKDGPQKVAKNLYDLALAHIENEKLYRVLYYDCPPLQKKATNPISGESIDFAKTPHAVFRFAFYEELKTFRKLALRMGYVQDNRNWRLTVGATNDLLASKLQIKNLSKHDVYLDMQQKGVDMKIGIDIASLAYKRLVDKIVLVSGDSDFISVAKLARREGIDFILDPMWKKIRGSLFEHIDGLRSTCPQPKWQAKKAKP